jgi:hypothetical protein
MPDINPSIIVHEIKTYSSVKIVRQKIHLVHPNKITTIKAEVEKNLKYIFIYPVPVIHNFGHRDDVMMMENQALH